MTEEERKRVTDGFDRLELVANTNATFQHGRDRRWSFCHWFLTGIALIFGAVAGVTGIGDLVGVRTVGGLAAIGALAGAFDSRLRYSAISALAGKAAGAFDDIGTRAAQFRDLRLADATYQDAVRANDGLQRELSQLIGDTKDAIPAAAVPAASVR